MIIDVEGFKPYPKQKEWIEEIERDEVKYITLLVGRQVGKSLVGENMALKWALENPNTILMWISPIYSQVRKVYDDIENVLQGTPLLVSSNKSNYEMVLLNGSKIIFRSGEKPDSLRGYTNDYLIVDEAAFIKDEVWEQILKPTILVRGKKVLFLSTPKNKGNYLYKLHLRGEDPEQKQYITLRGSSYDNPFIDKEELDEAKKVLPEAVFNQEILGHWIDSGGEVFTDIENYTILNEWRPYNPSKRYYAGIDVGRQDDFSVLTIIDDEGYVCKVYRERHKTWDMILSEMSKLLHQYKATAMVEVNGIGDALYEQLEKKYKNIHPFITTQQSKQQIVEDLIYELNTDKLYLPSEKLFQPLTSELKTFTFHYSPSTRKVSYRAIDGAHDDTIMSLALSLHSLREKKTKGSYYIY